LPRPARERPDACQALWLQALARSTRARPALARDPLSWSGDDERSNPRVSNAPEAAGGVTVRRPIVFGEILFDQFPDGSRVLGGAPLNVAAHLAGLGFEPLLISRVGDDADGRRIRDELPRRALDEAGIQRDPVHATGEVRVELVAGEPRFEILAERAWDFIDDDAAATAIAGTEAALLYHGTLAARHEVSRRALERLRRAAAAPVFIDVNLRPPWTPVARARELARDADWLKVSREELGTLLDETVAAGDAALAADARALIARLGVERLVVSDGPRGALLVERDGNGRAGETRVPAPELGAARFVDAVGAGDALAAVLVAGAVAGWPRSTALGRGTELAAAICGVRGALPESTDFYGPYCVAWGLGS
jgi:fructokinase